MPSTFLPWYEQENIFWWCHWYSFWAPFVILHYILYSISQQYPRLYKQLTIAHSGSSGKEAIETECITSSKRVSLTGLQYVLTWKHHQILKFSVTLSKRKGIVVVYFNITYCTPPLHCTLQWFWNIVFDNHVNS